MSAVADVLNGAADLIERDGWCRRISRRWRSDGQLIGRCAWGAICDAALRLGTTVRLSAAEAVEERVGQLLPVWNDTPGRTKAEVVAALRAAAERAL